MKAYLMISVNISNWFSILLIASLMLACKPSEELIKNPEISSDFDLSFAFGSCSEIDEDQHLWDNILSHGSGVWIWLGDIIYADTEDMSLMANQYRLQKQRPDYISITDSMTVIGVWDDHDYGVNNGGKEYPKKSESRDLLFEFLEVPETSPHWQHKGAYQDYQFQHEALNIHVILLDIRYFRDPLTYNSGRPQPNVSGTMLGDEQWEWLELTMSTSDADCFLIGSGIQVLPEDHKYEKWSNFPNERDRLLKAIRQSGLPTILLSGDRHIGEISKVELAGYPYPLYEVTSSSLTHSWRDAQEFNRHRVGPLMTLDNFGTADFKVINDSCRVSLHLITENPNSNSSVEFSFDIR